MAGLRKSLATGLVPLEYNPWSHVDLSAGSHRGHSLESEEGPFSRSTLYSTIIGMAWGGGLFAALSIYRSLASGGSVVQHLNPIAVMTVIGATVGGLIGPMIGAIRARRRSGDPRVSDSEQ